MIAYMTATARLPQHDATLPLGHRGVRGAILMGLKKAKRLTAKELASRLQVSLNGIRHHLKELESEGLIEYQRRYRGVGAPAFAYQLTPAGEALFPRRYEATLNEVLDQVVEREGRAVAVAVLEARYAALTRRLQEQLAGADPAERMASVARVLSEEGYMAEAAVTATKGTLIEHNCAIPAVAERFPEICAAEAKFLAAVLGAEVQRQGHILSGCSACEYRVHFNPSPSTAAGAADGPNTQGSSTPPSQEIA
jgi:DeoR family transcriptional regulator, suf operon transcriptional repressor